MIFHFAENCYSNVNLFPFLSINVMKRKFLISGFHVLRLIGDFLEIFRTPIPKMCITPTCPRIDHNCLLFMPAEISTVEAGTVEGMNLIPEEAERGSRNTSTTKMLLGFPNSRHVSSLNFV